jgi:Mn2+/Fe2+ NRAMP family transporter
MFVANSKMLGKYRNDGRANWLAGFVVIIVSILAVRKLIGLL